MQTQTRAQIEAALLYPAAIGADLWDRMQGGISAEESEKAARFVFEEDRRACLAAHWLKRRMLSRADPTIDPLSWRFALGAHGKPHLVGRTDLHFNLSHCHGLVACALRRDAAVGMDVEFVGRSTPREVVAHYLSAAEAAWWGAQPEADKATSFFRIWTLKEAFIKATGRGLAQQLQNFSISTALPALLPEGEWASDAHLWQLHQAELSSSHLLAVAWRRYGDREESVYPIIVQPGAWV